MSEIQRGQTEENVLRIIHMLRRTSSLWLSAVTTVKPTEFRTSRKPKRHISLKNFYQYSRKATTNIQLKLSKKVIYYNFTVHLTEHFPQATSLQPSQLYINHKQNLEGYSARRQTCFPIYLKYYFNKIVRIETVLQQEHSSQTINQKSVKCGWPMSTILPPTTYLILF